MKKGTAIAGLQKVGRSFMLPIAILPIAGLFLGIGATFTNPSFIEQNNLGHILGPGTVLNSILSVFDTAGGAVFGILPLLFAMAVALGLAKAERQVAALSGVVGFFLMYATLTKSVELFHDVEHLKDTIPGLVSSMMGFTDTLNMGVFGGVIIGLVVAFLHNRFYKVEFPSALSFFQGTRFVPIISALAGIVLGVVLCFLWPFAARGLAALGGAVAATGGFGVFIYGFIYRSLLPLGLHHVFYMPFWQTAVGGMEFQAIIDGVTVMGDQAAIFAAQAAAGLPQTVEGLTTIMGAQNIIAAQLAAGLIPSPEYAKFFSGMFPFMIFGFPMMALAMYHVARKEKRKQAKGLLVSASVTSIVTGVTEPIEFTLLFASPLLYFGVHCVLGALSFVITYLAGVGVAVSFSGGFIDLLMWGILPGLKTNWIWIIPIGLAYGAIYYFVFRILIVKMNLKTPGREDDAEETKLFSKADYQAVNKIAGASVNLDNAETAASKGVELAKLVVQGLGGIENITNFDNCATRLRVEVIDPAKVDGDLLKARTGAMGMIQNDKAVQVIYGPKVTTIKTETEEYMDSLK